jgi:hypothetical protein
MSQNGGQNLLKAGDYKLTKLLIRSTVTKKELDISNLYTQMELFEDMFSPYMSGTIAMNESFNAPEMVPITGQEFVEIEFKTDVQNVKPVRKIFRIYKLDKHAADPNGKGQRYTIHLISEGGLINYSQRCGYHVNGSVSKMIETIVTKHFPDHIWKDRFDIQPTVDNYSFVLPKSHTPFKAISWLTSKAVSGVATDYSPFFFYETFDGYTFKSLSKIIEDGSVKVQDYYYIKDKIAAPDGGPSSLPTDGPLSAIFHRVQALEELSRFNMAENIMNGVVSSRLLVHDMLRKEQRETQFRETDVFQDSTKLGTKSHYKNSDNDDAYFYKDPCAYYFLPSTNYTAYTEQNNIVDNTGFESFFLKRKYHLNAIMTQKIAIDVYGDSTKRVGQIINLYTPKFASDHAVKADKADKNFSGNYLITSVRHTFGTAYSCKMELSRNALGV